MSVEQVLEKIIAHNSYILGCIVRSGDRVYRQLPDLYDLVDCEEFSERAAHAFGLADELETGETPFDQMFAEFESHCIYARRIDDGVLVLVGEPMQRSQLRKMQVGVNLFMKPLSQALDASSGPATGQQASPGESSVAFPKLKRWYRSVAH